MVKKNDYWCPAPWIGLFINQLGNLKPCCKSSWPQERKANSVKEYLNSEWLESLKSNLNKNIQDPNCNTCWKEESAQRVSLRQSLRRFYSKRFVEKNKQGNIKCLHVIWDNTCNLKCRICDYEASSSWSSEILNNKNLFEKKELDIVSSYQKKIKEFDFFTFYENNQNYFDLVEITSTGGEPLLSKKHLQFLKKLINLGVSEKIFLFYNSNGSVYSNELVDKIWPKFKGVKIRFSIDDIEKRFEYQRHPAKWKEVLKNMEKFKNNNNIKLEIYSVISIFNILYVEELSEFVKKFGGTHWNIDVLNYPDEFNIKHLPNNVKLSLANKYTKIKEHIEIEKIINELQVTHAVDQNWKQNFINKIKLTDKIRNEDFATTFPEMNALIHKY